MYAIKKADCDSYIRQIESTLDGNYEQRLKINYTNNAKSIEVKFRTKSEALETLDSVRSSEWADRVELEIVDLRKCV